MFAQALYYITHLQKILKYLLLEYCFVYCRLHYKYRICIALTMTSILFAITLAFVAVPTSQCKMSSTNHSATLTL